MPSTSYNNNHGQYDKKMVLWRCLSYIMRFIFALQLLPSLIDFKRKGKTLFSLLIINTWIMIITFIQSLQFCVIVCVRLCREFIVWKSVFGNSVRDDVHPFGNFLLSLEWLILILITSDHVIWHSATFRLFTNWLESLANGFHFGFGNNSSHKARHPPTWRAKKIPNRNSRSKKKKQIGTVIFVFIAELV